MSRALPVAAPLLAATLLLAAALLLSCGGPSKSAKRKAPKAPSLIADIQAQATPGYQPGDAVVTFAVFTRGAPKDAENRARKALAAPAPKAFVAESGPPVAPSIATVKANELPIRLEAIAKGKHADAIMGASHATMVHSAGPSGPNQARLRWAALAAKALVGSGVIVDLTTRKAFDAAEFAAHIADPGFLAEQVTIAAFKESASAVMFHTEGMAKLGLPDIEIGGVPLKTAKLAFAGFQATVNEVRATGHVKPGDSTKMARFGKCERPPVTFTHECVRVMAPSTP